MGNIKLKAECSGHFTVRVLSAEEEVREEVSFPNLVTDGGLARMGISSGFLQYCVVGASSVPPSPTDTSMGSEIARTNNRPTYDYGILPDPPYYVFSRQTFRFTSGQAAGNISEVGVSWGSGATALFSRALVLDTEGNPTTITVQADEILEVTYEFRYYPPLEDSTGSVEFTGNIGGTYNWILRTANVNQTTTTQNGNGQSWTLQGSSQIQVNTSSSSGLRTYTSDIGPVTGTPSGSALSSNGMTHLSSSGTEATFRATMGLDSHNHSIRSIRSRMGICEFQIQFDPPIPKTPDDVLQLDFQISWGRRDDP